MSPGFVAVKGLWGEKVMAKIYVCGIFMLLKETNGLLPLGKNKNTISLEDKSGNAFL